jgi:hypothetical protein
VQVAPHGWNASRSQGLEGQKNLASEFGDVGRVHGLSMVIHEESVSISVEILKCDMASELLRVKCALFFEAVFRIAMKQKVPQAAASAPRPDEQQHAVVKGYNNNSIKNDGLKARHTCCRQ